MSTSEVPPLYRSSSTTGFCVSIKKHDKNREHFGGSSCLLSYLRSPTLRNAFWHWHTWAKALHKASSLVVAFGNWKERNRARMSYDNGIKELSRIWASGKRKPTPKKSAWRNLSSQRGRRAHVLGFFQIPPCICLPEKQVYYFVYITFHKNLRAHS